MEVNNEAAEVYERIETVLDQAESTTAVIRLMHWNVLADVLAYGFSKVNEDNLKKENRLPLIVKEIKASGIQIDDKFCLPHLICCQEMDMKDELLALLNDIEDTEYKAEDIWKTGDHNDALCIFYDTKTLNLLEVKKDNYRGLNNDNKTNRVYLMCLFEHIQEKRKLVVGTLHLKSKKPYRQVRVLEITEYWSRLKDFIQDIKDKNYISEEEELPVIITGDFNDEPDSPVVESMLDPDMTYGIKFTNAYFQDEKHPDFTTYKYRSEDVTKHTIDYIFYNSKLTLKSILSLPSSSQMSPEGNPCSKCASDHLSLSATFSLP